MGKEMSSLPGRSGMAIDIDAFLSTSARSMRRSVIRELLKLTSRGGIISFAGGFTDPATFPVRDAASAALGKVKVRGK